MKKIDLLIFVAALLFSACMTPFTTIDRQNIIKGGANCTQVQYYNDRPIELKREISIAEANTVNGKVRIEQGKHYEYIYIPLRTKAICIDDRTNGVLKIAFEDNASLNFWATKDGSQYILGPSGKRELLKNGAIISYGGKKYTIIRGSDACLLFENNMKIKESRERRTVRGIKI